MSARPACGGCLTPGLRDGQSVTSRVRVVQLFDDEEEEPEGR